MTAQSSKRPAAPCGDAVAGERTATSTTLICADGMGSGIKAHVAAEMCAARALELLRVGFSLRRAFASLVKTMEQAKQDHTPYVAFSLVRVLNDGETTVLSYEAPGPILIERHHATALPQRTVVVENAVTEETNCHLAPGEGVLVFSDGVSQAGLGGMLSRGWQTAGAASFVNDLCSSGTPLADIPRRVQEKAVQYSASTVGDDVTAALALCRVGNVVTILTGPPGTRQKDGEAAGKLLKSPGAKVVCGATTADVVARYLGTEVSIDREVDSLLAPPSYVIEGVDLVTEGAVTLNQLFNVLDEDPETFDEISGVTRLYDMLRQADRVNLIVGTAQNPANAHVSFRQQGIMPRARIVPMIADKLREAGKLVVVEKV